MGRVEGEGLAAACSECTARAVGRGLGVAAAAAIADIFPVAPRTPTASAARPAVPTVPKSARRAIVPCGSGGSSASPLLVLGSLTRPTLWAEAEFAHGRRSRDRGPNGPSPSETLGG